MNDDGWLEWARRDAGGRGLAALVPLLDAMGDAAHALRQADWNTAADRDPRDAHTIQASVPDPAAAADRGTPAGAPPAVDSRRARLGSHPRTIAEASAALDRGAVTSRELTDACLAEIERRNPALNAFILVTPELARRQADEADRERRDGYVRGPLHGVPLSLKDLIDVAGAPTTAASQVAAARIASRDAEIVQRLRQAGAVFVGKTNLHEFALGTTNEDSAWGPARHPLDPSRSPGGSSGGAAVSVTTGMAMAAIGTDTGGSIRIPAALCGLVGLKPGFGEISTDGIIPLSTSLDHVGPLARSVADAAMVTAVMRGEDATAARQATETGVPDRPLRLGLLTSYFLDVIDEPVRAAFESALTTLADRHTAIVERSIPHAPLIAPVYLHIALAEAAAWHAATLERRPGDYTRNVRLRLEMGRYMRAEDYVRAMAGREVLRREVDAALEDCDALLLPTLPVAAWPIGLSSVTIGGSTHPIRNLTLRLTQLFNLTGHPALTLPAGVTPEGLPVGVQLVGRRGHTEALLRLGRAVEARLAASSG